MKYSSTTDRPPFPGKLAALNQAAHLDSLLIALLVGLVALLPRLIGLNDFFTTDEAYHWVSRCERFAAALAEGRWADTQLTGHPGVSLMWLGSLGLKLEQLAVSMGWAAPPDTLAHLAWLRTGPVLAHSATLVAGYLLLRRLVRPPLALVAALLWATSPFLVAQGRLLHLDALLTDLCSLTLLTTLVACRAERARPWLIGAGMLCGLALLTKGPALILLPVLGLSMFALAAPDPRGWGWSFIMRLRWALPRYLGLLAVAAITAFLLWPAAWAIPDQAMSSYIGEIVGNGGRANGDGQFFLGSSNPDPGPLFYPLIGLYRLTPVELLGLVLLPFSLWQWKRVCSLDPAVRQERAVLLVLGAFALFWVLVMTAGPKKFDRYVLPIWPALLMLAAYGLVSFYERFTQLGRIRLGMPHLATGLLAFQSLTLAWYHPYYLSYYNPLLGGGWAAQRMFLVGWGEGMDQVGAWLRTRSDLGYGQILSALPPTLQPFVSVPVREVRDIDTIVANYAVVYLESRQRVDAPAIYERIQATVPLHTVTIHGIEYAQIYQLARPYSTALGAEFGGSLRLAGYTLSQTSDSLLIMPAWDTRARIDQNLTVFVFVFDAAGNRVAQIDVAPGGSSLPPTSQWQPGEQVSVPLPVPLPAGLPAGDYSLTLGLYNPETGVRVPLTAGPRADPALAGSEAVLLGRFTRATP